MNRATTAFVALGLIWGSNFLFMKWASETITAGQITLLRVSFGFLPVLVYAAVRRAFARHHLRCLHHSLVMSLIATSVYYFAFAAGTALLPSGVAGALSGAIPLRVSAMLRVAQLPSMQRVRWLADLAHSPGHLGRGDSASRRCECCHAPDRSVR